MSGVKYLWPILHRSIMTRQEARVIQKALQWWNSRRPLAYDRIKHLAEPRINLSDDAERQLADAVAKYVKFNLRTKWKRK